MSLDFARGGDSIKILGSFDTAIALLMLSSSIPALAQDRDRRIAIDRRSLCVTEGEIKTDSGNRVSVNSAVALLPGVTTSEGISCATVRDPACTSSSPRLDVNSWTSKYRSLSGRWRVQTRWTRLSHTESIWPAQHGECYHSDIACILLSSFGLSDPEDCRAASFTSIG